MKNQKLNGRTKRNICGRKGRKALTAVLCVVMACMLGGCAGLQGMLLLVNREMSGLQENGLEELGGSSELTEESLTPFGKGLRSQALEAAPEAQMYDTGMEALMSPENWNTEEYKYHGENGWMNAVTSPFSTFAADVDTASYANLRRMLLEGREIPKDAVRIEEMINYFDYDYPDPSGEDPFSVTARIAPCPWNEETQLMLVGLKARDLNGNEDKDTRAGDKAPSNLVFLIDVSGSMDEYNKLPLVQRAFRLLVNELGEEDRVSIVTYANGDAVVLEGASGDEKSRICDAIEDLEPFGGTNGSQGIVRAYELARKQFKAKGLAKSDVIDGFDHSVAETLNVQKITIYEMELLSFKAVAPLNLGRVHSRFAAAEYGPGSAVSRPPVQARRPEVPSRRW